MFPDEEELFCVRRLDIGANGRLRDVISEGEASKAEDRVGEEVTGVIMPGRLCFCCGAGSGKRFGLATGPATFVNGAFRINTGEEGAGVIVHA